MKKSKSTLTPKLRFPEFRDAGEWKKSQCSDIAYVWQGYGFPDRYQGQCSGKYPFYKVSDISAAVEHGGQLIDEAQNCIDETVLKKLKAKPVPAGTIVFAKIGEAIRKDRRALTTRPAVIDNNVAGVKAITGKMTDDFLFYLWTTVSLMDFSGGVVPAVSKTAIENIPVSYPEEKDEQKKIADCLSSLDGLIAAEGRTLEALKAHKKGLMQQLFPQPGQTQPRLRFPEFRDAGEWEQRNLVKLTDELGDGDWIESKDQSNQGIRIIQTGNIGEGVFIHKSGNARYISSDTFARLNCSEVFPGDCLVSRLPDPIGRCCLIPDIGNRMVTAVDCAIIRFDSARMLPYFFVAYSQTRNYLQEADALGSGSTRKRISRENLSRIKVPLPELNEQHRIADCLSSLDTQIAVQATKIDALKTHKLGLMQQLFPAPEEQ